MVRTDPARGSWSEGISPAALSATGHGTGEAARKGSLLVRARLSAFRSYKLRLSWANAEERTAVHICYGYGIKANNDWKATLGEHWRQYEETFPALAASRIDQVSLECRNARVPIELIGLLKGKDVLIARALRKHPTAEDILWRSPRLRSALIF